LNKFRTHTCGELTKKFTKKDVILSGWINKKREIKKDKANIFAEKKLSS